MRVADGLARALAAAGVRHAFGIPGGEVLALIEALGGAGIEFVTARHETAAGLMAEGSALATGAPGLFVVTVGPGLTNSVNAVANAHLDRVPLIVCSGAPEGRFTHQVLDQRALLQPIVKASFRVTANDALEAITRAIELAMAHPRGPVQLDLAPSVALEPLAPTRPVPAAKLREFPAGPIRAAAGWLARAERPLVLAGLEAAQPRVALALEALLSRWPAPVLTTYKAKGVLPERDPRCVGAIALSPRADAIVARLIARADAFLLVGYDPVEMRASYVDPFPQSARVIELSEAPRDHGMHVADLEWSGELAPALEALAREMPRVPRTEIWADGEPAHVRAQLHAGFTCKPGGRFSPLDVVTVLGEVVPETVQLTVDTGAHRILLSQSPIARRAGHVAQSNGLCTMGYALPAAIGWSLASGGERAVAAMGDGGFEMVLGELATLRDLALPVTIVVFDDRSLALIDLKQRAAGYASRGVTLGATDHLAIARAFGGSAERVAERAGFEQALRRALERKRGFSLISCALEREAYDGAI